MADKRFPLLRGQITSADTFQAPRQAITPPTLPFCKPRNHRAQLLEQLNEVVKLVKGRPAGARDQSAEREIIAVHPVKNSTIDADQLDSSRADAKLIGVVPDTDVVLLDVKDAGLGHIRKKIDDFANDALVTTREKDGQSIVHRKSETAIAPIERISLASLEDVLGLSLRRTPLEEGRAYWFEIGCRGGYRQPREEGENSRGQLARQLQRIGAAQRLDEFHGPGLVYFFVRVTRGQLTELRNSTDCIFDVELAPESIRDMQMLQYERTKDVKNITVVKPPADAPSVVVLDTGIATGHPLLKDAILSATTCGSQIPSPEDTHGHGTKMAGIALYGDLGGAVEQGRLVASHWLQSSRLLVNPGAGVASDSECDKWPNRTRDAVHVAEAAEPQRRKRVFAMAVTRSMQDERSTEIGPTLWSHAIDQLAYHDGRGRLMLVAAGNARYEQWLGLAEQYPQLQLSEKIHQPAQAANALTVGAFTRRVTLPPGKDYEELQLVAKEAGGISPFTSTGISGSGWPTKPDVVLEGGNLALSGSLTNSSVPTLGALTTGHHHIAGRPFGLLSMTSEATARAANLAAHIWAKEPKLRPETVRGLIVHSAAWTPTMLEHFPGIDDRLSACGYGVPDEVVASECIQERATILIEDSIPNAVIEQEPKKERPVRATTKTTEPKVRRKVKLYRLPIPSELLSDSDPEVELRVTLSYFAEPSKAWNKVFLGLDLKWDMQGPLETEQVFLERINADLRPKGRDGKPLKYTVTTRSFPWEVGTQRRSRGTVQSDRWRGNMSDLAGDKLIAVEPVLGWWDRRKDCKTREMNFSLIVSVLGPGVYAAIKPRVEVQTAIAVEI